MRLNSILFASMLMAAPHCAFAQSEIDDWDVEAPSGKFTFTLALAVTETEVVLTDSQVSLPDDLQFGEVDVTLAEDVTVSNTFVGGVIGYRVLPFLELNAQAGFISTGSELGLTINGTPSDTFPIDFGGPISLDRDFSTSADGYSLGIGATGFVPLASIGDEAIVAYGTYQHLWNEFSDDGISVDIGRVTTGLLYPISAQSKGRPVFRLGVAYVNSTRTLERGVDFGGDQIMVNATQETEDPWSGELGIAYPASRNVIFSFGTSVQTTGNVSVFGSITLRP